MKETGDVQAVFNDAYASLNTAQKKAVDTIEGPVMVIAGPGTGKTQILTLRIANILQRTQVAPENILALTFTNAGVRVMRERLRTYIKDDAYRVGIYTFHSFAEHILQMYGSYFPSREFASVITELEKAKILEKILQQHDFQKIVSTYDRFSSLTQVMDAINDIKQEGLRPEEFEALIPRWEKEQMESDSMFYKRATGKYKAGDIKPAEKKKVEDRVTKAYEIATVFAAYQKELTKRNLYDFSDMIITVLAELKQNENLKLDLQEQYQYVLVDEHQDTNDGQNKLIEFLTDAEHLGGRPNLFTVGDEKQSIYRFQGASDTAFTHFKNHYNDVQFIELEQNYRSTTAILDASHHLITHSLPDAQILTSNQPDDVPVSVREFSDYKFELLYVAEQIKSKIEEGVSPDEIAVIYRSNKHLSEIKMLFQQFGVPYQVRSRDTLLDDPAITMFIMFMRVVADQYDDASLAKLLLAEFLNLDALTVAKTLRAYRQKKRSEQSNMGLIEFIGADGYYKEVVKVIGSMATFAANHQFPEVFKEVLNASGFLKHILSHPDSRSGLQKVEVLFNEVRQQAEGESGYTVQDFIAFIDATLAYNLNIEVTATSIGKGVQCMTAHGSKGLEFEYVYLLNTARSNWEKSRGFARISLPLSRYSGDLDDERRLFYVAITRAKRYLSITSSKQNWSGKSLEPSQFISELDIGAIPEAEIEAFETEHEPDLLRFFANDTPDDSLFAVEYLAERFIEENLSVTSLNNYIDCPLKYLFRNLIQLPDVYTPALRYGDTMHRALEKFFIASKEAGKILSREVLLGGYEDVMKTSGFMVVDYERFLLKGRQSLGMYHDYYHETWTTDVSLEEYIKRSFSLNKLELTLSGKIDKIEYLDEMGTGHIRVVDYKTGKVFSKKSTKAQKEALERQIRFYHLLLERYKGGTIIITEAVLDFIEPTEENAFEQKSLAVSEEDLIELKGEIATMAEEVLSGSFLTKGCGKKECEWCQLWKTLRR